MPTKTTRLKACEIAGIEPPRSECHRGAVLAVDRWPDDVPVPIFGPRMVCTGCGTVGADARPNWTDRTSRPSLTGAQ